MYTHMYTYTLYIHRCIYVHIHIYIYIYREREIYIYIYIYIYIAWVDSSSLLRPPPPNLGAGPGVIILHTCHILPPSEIDWRLFLAVFTGSEGKHLFHRIG